MNLLGPGYMKLDALSGFVGLFICLFSILVAIYSLPFMSGKKRQLSYYLYFLLTAIGSLGVVFSNNLVLLMVFWGILGLLLYLLIGFGQKPRTSYTAKKTFIIIGGTDAFMLMGLAIVWQLTGSMNIDSISIPITDKWSVIAYLCLAVGALAKAGAMPFHTWVPDTSEDAPIPVVAFLPACLDKLLGIYLLARISLDMFVLDAAMNTVLMIIGSVTIVAAVMMALVQHDLKRLLGYHAVSQVGYMVLGIGTANPIGIAGGLFHMLNNAIYKSMFFLSGGIVEKKAGTSDLDNLGGLAKALPLTFLCFLTGSFAISGVPPFNGFVSKWMIYQGIIEMGKAGNGSWVIWLIAAMFGSALTLASFMKLLHAIFLGQRSKALDDRGLSDEKVSRAMLLPVVLLALLCIIFGVFAFSIPLRIFIIPAIKSNIMPIGIWEPGIASLMIIVGIVIGIILGLLGAANKGRVSKVFVGGEELSAFPEMRLSGTEFYNNIQNIPILKFLYVLAERKIFDIYEVGTKITLAFNALLRYIHNGVLSSYLAWCLLGMIILFYIFFLR